MRVALDARTMQPQLRGGIGRSLANLLPLLGKEVDLHLLLDSRLPEVDVALPQSRLSTPVPGVSASWLQLSAPRWLRGFQGVFHCPFYALPAYLPVPGVVTLHDITFEHFPSWFSRRHGASFRIQARRAAKTASCVLTPSEFVRQDLVETYGVRPDDVLVAPQGVDPVFRPDADTAPVLARLGIRAPYVVALGGAGRRNLPLALAAWRAARKEGVDVGLVVVGPDAPPPEEGLVRAGPVPDDEWAALLAGAAGFLYPTSYEGFGMPGLEALACGAPVVAARVGALPEVLGEACVWSDSLAVADLAAALDQLMGDEPARRELRDRALLRASEAPGWEASAAAHLEAYRRAAA